LLLSLKPRKPVTPADKTSTDYPAAMQHPGDLGARIKSDSCSIKSSNMFQGGCAQWATTKLIRKPGITEHGREGRILPSMAMIMIVKFLKARKANGMSVRAANPDH